MKSKDPAGLRRRLAGRRLRSTRGEKIAYELRHVAKDVPHQLKNDVQRELEQQAHNCRYERRGDRVPYRAGRPFNPPPLGVSTGPIGGDPNQRRRWEAPWLQEAAAP